MSDFGGIFPVLMGAESSSDFSSRSEIESIAAFEETVTPFRNLIAVGFSSNDATFTGGRTDSKFVGLYDLSGK